jgi:serine phosphatase RsbU (regulator of sigma subunit)
MAARPAAASDTPEGVLSTTANGVGGVVSTTASGVGGAVSTTASGVGGAVSTTASGVGGVVSTTASGVGGVVSTTASGVGGAVSTTASGVGGAVSTTASGVGGAVSTTASGVGGAVSTTASNAGKTVSTTASGVGGAVSTTASGVGGAVSTTASGSGKPGADNPSSSASSTSGRLKITSAPSTQTSDPRHQSPTASNTSQHTHTRSAHKRHYKTAHKSYQRGQTARTGSSTGKRTKIGAGTSIGQPVSHAGSSAPAKVAPAPEHTPAALEFIENHIPTSLGIALAALAAVALALAGWSGFQRRRSQAASQHAAALDADVDMLHAAILPAPLTAFGPATIAVAYRPAEGLAAGGDFTDVFALDDHRLAIILGDISGHGRQAIRQATLVHYTLRAYLSAGLAPRDVLALAGQSLSGDSLAGAFATVVVAILDREAHTLTWSGAGHPAPIIRNHHDIARIDAPGSVPLGLEFPTGDRQTTIVLDGPTRMCFFSDGLTEARRNGALLGEEGLDAMLAGIEATDAEAVLDQVATYADATTDDRAVCLIDWNGGPQVHSRTEELVIRDASDQGKLDQLLAACQIIPQALEPHPLPSVLRCFWDDHRQLIEWISLGDERERLHTQLLAASQAEPLDSARS